MNTERIQAHLNILTEKLRSRVKDMGPVKVAELTGLHKQDISAWLNGKRKWSLEKIIAVAEKLGI